MPETRGVCKRPPDPYLPGRVALSGGEQHTLERHVMGRPASDLDDYLDWQERLESYKASGLDIGDFCLREGVSRSTFHRWVDRLKEGIPESITAEKVAREETESGEAAFVPITLKSSPVEIELPNGGIVRLPLGVGQAVLVDVIRAVGTLKPWKAPKS